MAVLRSLYVTFVYSKRLKMRPLLLYGMRI